MKVRILTTVVVVLILAGCTGAPAEPAAVSGNLVITNGTVIDSTGADSIADGVVVIAGDRITAVGTAADFVLPPDATRIDVQGGTIMPGFINAHVHAGYSEANLEAWAQGGVTTVRDLGNGGDRGALFALRDSYRDQPQFARLVAVGPWVSVPDGYQGA